MESSTTRRSTDEIIESIAHITGHADRDLLEASLASGLYGMLEIDRVTLYRVIYERDKPQTYLAIEVNDGKAEIFLPGEAGPERLGAEQCWLDECLNSKLPLLTDSGGGQCLYLHPITDHLRNVSAIFCLSGDRKHCRENQNLLAAYFQIYRNYLRLLDESEHDNLTGLLNRRTFDQNLERVLAEWHAGTEQTRPDGVVERRNENGAQGNWLAVIDIDFFKRVNDQYGHLYGDEVLLLLSNIMRKTFRAYDKLFRFGGEEFVVILKKTNQAGAQSALERFRRAIEANHFPQVGKITVSIGYSEISGRVIPAQLLGRADEALYYAKDHGRNQVHQFERLVAEGLINTSQATVNDDVELF